MSRSPIMDALSNSGATSGELYIQGAKFEAELAKVREELGFINETAKKFYAHAGIAEMQAEKHPALVVRQAAAEIIRTRAERDAAVADAERYRWLRVRNELHEVDPSGPYAVCDDADALPDFLTAAELDAAIDAARKEGNK